MNDEPIQEELRQVVRQRYAEIAEAGGSTGSCCEPTDSACCGPGDGTRINLEDQVSRLYQAPEAGLLPEEVKDLSLGCGDPVTLASLQPGQTVLDLGSGGGIDCFIAAQRVGPTGQVIGVDMTPAMISRARENKARIGAGNVSFRLGEIEHLPVADGSVDVIISNCVINLSPDKAQVLKEAYRVLRPGGKLAVSDIVTDGPLPQEVKDSLSAWAGCVAGALEVDEYRRLLAEAGFHDISVEKEPLDRQSIDQAVAQLDIPLNRESLKQGQVYQSVFSARITAIKAA